MKNEIKISNAIKLIPENYAEQKYLAEFFIDYNTFNKNDNLLDLDFTRKKEERYDNDTLAGGSVHYKWLQLKETHRGDFYDISKNKEITNHKVYVDEIEYLEINALRY